ncbi:type VI secretion system tip protein TssI/VgrG [Robbsia sp. Bb-Pol-6]|uniref:Type VI secretion system tip protein TssI/VgrG n=1 Tax=Robbsia betulipollinis TaxID=2981849 RepID=A0ABT3ZKC2_9BURK|nr:type VI secretion system tip protein TssI/VgrG [Robbsia betulipollinis]MCY0386978.1 type VI secretion system tip protein TssI/VgrG [Robbsia betulipollinis]
MNRKFTQDGALLSVTTPFGDDVLLLERFVGREAISEPFQFQLTMRSSNPRLDPDQIVGAPVSVTLSMKTRPRRDFNGIVTRFTHVGGNGTTSRYIADVAPRMWLLTLGNDRRIYQNQTAADIVKQILGAGNVAFEDGLTRTYASRPYCVCYDESPFSFISRLMEEEGIFYFFTFAAGRHTLVLADAASAHPANADVPVLRYLPERRMIGAVDIVSDFDLVCKLVVKTCMLNDYDFQQSATPLLTGAAGRTGRGMSYLYPGKHGALNDGTRLAKSRVDAQQLDSATGRGTSQCHPMAAGTQFRLRGHPRTTLNVAHVVRSVTHHAGDDEYSNAFETFPSSARFQPPRLTPRPVVAGMHTAVVVGPRGEEIWTDALGRVKVQFHWDRFGANDEKSSCWVRVAQIAAGQGWGQLFVPRIGHEVLIAYVDGDPDRPLITGSVYNDTQTPPVPLPGSQTQSVIRSRSSKNGTAGNEIRMEDKLGGEQLFLHAQKDLRIDVENDLTTTLVSGSEVRTLEKGDRTIDVRTGKETHTVEGTRDLAVTGDETHRNGADFVQTVKGNFTLKVSGDLLIDVAGSVKIQSGTTLTSHAGTAMLNRAGMDMKNESGTTLANKAGTTLSNQGLMIESKASTTQVVDGGGVLTLKGGRVEID